MSEQLELGFEPYPRMPDFNQVLTDRVKPGFDPHTLMMKKKDVLDGNAELPIQQQWPENEIKMLEEFCKKYGIIGFNCGRMSPIAALSMLKQKLGVVDEERVTYSKAMQGKLLLKG